MMEERSDVNFYRMKSGFPTEEQPQSNLYLYFRASFLFIPAGVKILREIQGHPLQEICNIHTYEDEYKREHLASFIFRLKYPKVNTKYHLYYRLKRGTWTRCSTVEVTP